MKKSESFQTIHRMHTPNIKTEFGERCMEDLGVIKGLEMDEVANYVLIPMRVTINGKEETRGWEVFKIKKECDVEVETWKNLEANQVKEGEGQ